MELGFSFISSLLVALLLYSFLKLWKKPNKNNRIRNLPPGPWKLPIIGNLHQLVGVLPQRVLRDLAKKYGPIMHLQLGEICTIVISSPEFAKQVMKTHDVIFASRPQDVAATIMSYDNTDIIFAPYGDYWRQLRKICISELLSIKRVKSFRSIREEEMSNLIKWIDSRAGSMINLTDEINSLMYCITSRAAFGKKCKDQELFVTVSKEILQLVAGFNVSDLFPSIGLIESMSGIKSRAETVHKKADRIVDNIINDHRKRKASKSEISKTEEDEDLVDILLKIQELGGHDQFHLTTDNIKSVITDVFTAGSETSATVVDWAMSEMMKNPTLMKKAQAEVREIFNKNGKIDETGIDEMKFLKLVIKETLRFHPPAPLLMPRECGQSCEINGFNIPIKAKVIVNAWAIGRDPEYWTDPERFIPERFLDCSIDYKGSHFEYIPFGAGRRICPGMSFGLANVELPLAMLLYHFDWKLPNGMEIGDLDMTEAFGLSGRRKDDLQVLPIPYHSPLVAREKV